MTPTIWHLVGPATDVERAFIGADLIIVSEDMMAEGLLLMPYWETQTHAQVAVLKALSKGLPIKAIGMFHDTDQTPVAYKVFDTDDAALWRTIRSSGT